ncbi:MAG: TlpA family protein disulfide reductase [Clostridiales bacterium]|nr:TlpA family protein disulfide reductase [Clostridiales bacterium]
MKRKLLLLMAAAILAVGVIGLTACGSENTESESKAFGEFQTVDLNGNEVTNEVFANSKLTMVNVWATYCGYCIDEMPALGEISREHDKTEFQILGLVSDVATPGEASAMEIVQTTGADYTHMLTNEQLRKGILQDVQGVPTTFFVDNKGNRIGATYAGKKSKDEWKKIIEEMMENLDDEK